eukprot:23547_1
MICVMIRTVIRRRASILPRQWDSIKWKHTQQCTIRYFSTVHATRSAQETLPNPHQKVISKIEKSQTVKPIKSILTPKEIKKHKYDHTVFAAAINRCNRLKQIRACQIFMKLCIDFGMDNVECYNAMMKACHNQNQNIQQSLELLTQMESNHVLPNTDTFHLLLQQCISHIDIKNAERIWQKMSNSHCAYVDESYIAMIIIYSKYGDLELVEKAIHEMQKSNVKIDARYKDYLTKYSALSVDDEKAKMKVLIELEQAFSAPK